MAAAALKNGRYFSTFAWAAPSLFFGRLAHQLAASMEMHVYMWQGSHHHRSFFPSCRGVSPPLSLSPHGIYPPRSHSSTQPHKLHRNPLQASDMTQARKTKTTKSMQAYKDMLPRQRHMLMQGPVEVFFKGVFRPSTQLRFPSLPSHRRPPLTPFPSLPSPPLPFPPLRIVAPHSLLPALPSPLLASVPLTSSPPLPFPRIASSPLTRSLAPPVCGQTSCASSRSTANR